MNENSNDGDIIMIYTIIHYKLCVITEFHGMIWIPV